jgi:hypothetical protein
MSKQIQRSRDAAFIAQNGLCYHCEFAIVKSIDAGTPRAQRHFLCTAEHLVPASCGS